MDITEWLQSKSKKLANSPKTKRVSKVVMTLSVAIVVMNSIFDLIDKKEKIYRWLKFDQCYIRDPFTAKPDRNLGIRQCLDGQVSFIKMTYGFDELDSSTGIPKPKGRPNRVFQIESVNGGEILWMEQQLLQVQNGQEIWSKGAKVSFFTVQNGRRLLGQDFVIRTKQAPVAPPYGMILRRIDDTPEACGTDPMEMSSASDQTRIALVASRRNNPVGIMEIFVPATLEDARISNWWTYSRYLTSMCEQDISPFMKFGPQFQPYNQINLVIADRG